MEKAHATAIPLGDWRAFLRMLHVLRSTDPDATVIVGHDAGLKCTSCGYSPCAFTASVGQDGGWSVEFRCRAAGCGARFHEQQQGGQPSVTDDASKAPRSFSEGDPLWDNITFPADDAVIKVGVSCRDCGAEFLLAQPKIASALEVEGVPMSPISFEPMGWSVVWCSGAGCRFKAHVGLPRSRQYIIRRDH